MVPMDHRMNDTARPMTDEDTDVTSPNYSHGDLDDGMFQATRTTSTDSAKHDHADPSLHVGPPPLQHRSRSSSNSTTTSRPAPTYPASTFAAFARNDGAELQRDATHREGSISNHHHNKSSSSSINNSSSSSSNNVLHGSMKHSSRSSELAEHNRTESQEKQRQQSAHAHRHRDEQQEDHHQQQEHQPQTAQQSQVKTTRHRESSGHEEVVSEEDLSQLSRVALEERVRLGEAWNQRLHRQIEELMQLPRTALSAMRERMYNADIALPLLQCYDAALSERNDIIAELRSTLRNYTGEHEEMSTAVCAAEQLAQHIQHRACGELSKAAATQQIREQELSALRAELTQALDAAHAARVERDMHAKQVARAQRELEGVRAEWMRSQNTLREMRERAGGATAAGASVLGGHNQGMESQEQQQLQRVHEQSDQIQLQVLRRVHKDTMHELEQLRDRMIHALKQSSDNHAAHLRVVEERHRTVVEELRAVCRTHELEIVKLRAQLARVECCGVGGGVIGSVVGTAAAAASPLLSLKVMGSTARTTAELVDMQARQSQEMELSRVQAQLLSLQSEHESTVRRWEQKVRSVRSDCDEELHALREAVQRAQSQMDRYKETNARLERMCDKERTESAALSQKLRESAQSVNSLRLACDAAENSVRELTEKLHQAEQTVAQTQSSGKQSLCQEREKMAALEQRVQTVIQQMQVSVTRATEASNRASEARDEAVSAQRELERRLERALARVEEGQQQLESKETQVSRLTETLEQHRRQVRELNERSAVREQQLREHQQQLRKHVLALESLKLDNARLMRAQERRMGGGRGGIRAVRTE